MHVAVVLLLVAVGLAGCTYEDDPGPEFEATCPWWFPSPSVPKWSSPQGAMRHDADSTNPSARDPNDWTKWVPTPGDVNATPQYNATTGLPIPDSDPKIYGDGTLGFVELSFKNVSLVDSLLVFEAYRASDREPPTTPAGEDPIPPTGPRLQFTTALRQGGQISSEVRFGPHVGHDNPLTGQDAKVYIDLQPAPDQVNPSRIRIDARYYGNQDGNVETDSVAVFDQVSATFWYLHNDCVR